jgi:histidyl-tRNA synthetase
LAKANTVHLENKDSNKVDIEHSESIALWFDCSVCSYVVQHQNDIEFPFKDIKSNLCGVQTGLRKDVLEFFQCDADVVGSKLWQEVELVQLYDTVFTELDWKEWPLKLNRKILSGIAGGRCWINYYFTCAW